MVGLVAVLLISVASAVGLNGSHHRAEAALEDRYLTRAALASAAVDTYVSQLMDTEQRASLANLVNGTDRFGIVVSTFGFSAAVLLDADGKVLAVHPAKPALIGEEIASQYPHLTAAVGGRRAISPVVPAAATGEPVVGFAVPFNTPSGRRVFSGAYPVSATPLQAYLRSMVSLRTSRLFLVDDQQHVLASSLSVPVTRDLQASDSELAQAYSAHGVGRYSDQFLASRPVAGTPWVVVAAISQRELLRPVNGWSQLTPWLILAMLVLSALWLWVVLRRRYAANLRLHEALANLDRVSRQDGLTGAHNRRSTEERLIEAREQTLRETSPLSVLMIDVDHFKCINDTFGHRAGDDALMAVASRLQACLRPADVLGRWGGEEFLVVLPGTDGALAGVIAERLRAAIALEPIFLGSGGEGIPVTVSLGLSSSAHATTEVLVHTADKAMYTAKAEGRNCVRTINPIPDGPPLATVM